MSVILVIQEMEIGRNWVWLEASLGKKLARSHVKELDVVVCACDPSYSVSHR
jgi:hypothetical protein